MRVRVKGVGVGGEGEAPGGRKAVGPVAPALEPMR